MRHAVLALLTLAVATDALAERVARHPFHSSVPRGRVQRIVIDIPMGEINVRNGAADRLTVAGQAKRDFDNAREGEWARDVVRDTSVEIYVNGAEAVVRRRFGPDAQSWRAQKFTTVELTLDVPPGIDLDFETTAGEVTLVGSFGDVDLDMRAGEIELRTPRKGVRELSASCRVGEVRTNLGDEIVTREGILPGRTRYYNAAGKSHVNLHVTAGEVDVVLTP